MILTQFLSIWICPEWLGWWSGGLGVSPSPDLTIPSPPMILSFTLCQKPVTHTTTPPHHPTAPCPFIPAIVKPCVACLQSFLMIFDSRMISRSGCRSVSVSVQWIFAQSRFPGHRFACLFGLALGIALVHLVAPKLLHSRPKGNAETLWGTNR